MLAFHRTLSFRYVRQRWSRALLVIASIALGVATLVATQALSDGMTRAAQGAVNPMAGTADLLVANSDRGVQLAVADDLRGANIPGLADIRPLVISRATLPDLGERPVVLLGVAFDPARATGDNPWGVETRVTNLVALTSSNPRVFVGADLAGNFAEGLGKIRVRVAGKVHEVAGLGTLDARGPAATLGGSVLAMDLADAARLLGKADACTRIDLALASDCDRDEVRRRVAAVVGHRAEVKEPKDNERAIHDVMAGLELAFLLGGVGALVVGLFLVYNALSVTVTERRHDIGILRSLGATRTQVASLFAAEAVLLGLAGAALGVPLGIGLAHVSTGPMQEILSDIFLPMSAGAVPITMSNIVTAVLAGSITTLVASIVPALRAANQEPADAVRRVPSRHGWRARVLSALGSGVVILAGMALIGLRDRIDARFGGSRTGSFGGLAIVLVGILLATPLLAEAAAHLLRPLARRLLGIEGRLAADNLARSPGRTGLVIAALAAGVALMFQTAGLTLSSEGAILDWVDRSIAADLFVTCNSPIAASGNSQPLREQVGRELATLPDVEAVLPIRFQRAEYGATNIFIVALDAQQFYDMGQQRPGIEGRDPFPQLTQPHTALISENFAALHGVHIGDTVTLRGHTGPVRLRVVGTVLDYTWNRGSLFLDRARYIEYFGDPLVDSFDLYVRPGADVEAVRRELLHRWGAQEGLVASTREELRDVIATMLRRLYALAYSQQLVVGLVAALGVVTALLISVLQRRRELGLLRAVGASQGQIVRTVLAEAVLMGVIGAVIGLLFGIPLEWYAVRVIMLEETGFSFAVRIPWLAAGVVALLALAVATLAGLGPAVHAMRQRIAEAIAYE